MTKEEAEELQAIFDRGKRYPTSNLFMPLEEDETRYYELMEKHAEAMYEAYRKRGH